jgi:hypothetical protein
MSISASRVATAIAERLAPSCRPFQVRAAGTHLLIDFVFAAIADP